MRIGKFFDNFCLQPKFKKPQPSKKNKRGRKGKPVKSKIVKTQSSSRKKKKSSRKESRKAQKKLKCKKITDKKAEKNKKVKEMLPIIDEVQEEDQNPIEIDTRIVDEIPTLIETNMRNVEGNRVDSGSNKDKIQSVEPQNDLSNSGRFKSAERTNKTAKIDSRETQNSSSKKQLSANLSFTRLSDRRPDFSRGISDFQHQLLFNATHSETSSQPDSSECSSIVEPYHNEGIKKSPASGMDYRCNLKHIFSGSSNISSDSRRKVQTNSVHRLLKGKHYPKSPDLQKPKSQQAQSEKKLKKNKLKLSALKQKLKFKKHTTEKFIKRSKQLYIFENIEHIYKHHETILNKDLQSLLLKFIAFEDQVKKQFIRKRRITYRKLREQILFSKNL